MTHILVVDNYDSFVYTLNGYLHQLGATTDVIRNDDVAVEDLPALVAKYDGILVSPGPGTPADAGISISIVHEASSRAFPFLECVWATRPSQRLLARPSPTRMS